MKKQEICWEVDIRVPFSKKSRVLEMMELFRLKIKQKSLVNLSEINRLGIKDILSPGEKQIDVRHTEEKTIGDRLIEFMVCGYQLADNFWDHEEKIPNAWDDADNFIFGDIFENQYKVEFMLIYLRREKKCQFFPIPEVFSPKPNTFFVCFKNNIGLEN